MLNPAISVRALTKTYHEGSAGTLALRGVDLDVYPGELVLLMGPSGSGKTTLLSIVGCILTATSGSVRILGKEVTGLSQDELPSIRLAHIGFIFQGFNLFQTLTARENVELMLGLKGVQGQAATRRAQELLDQVGLGPKARSFPSDLSGGEKQRVAIARALAGEPQIILADEPTASLDSKVGRNVLGILRSLAHDRGGAVVVVTHDPRALEFGDRIISIEDGMIAEPARGDEQFPVALPAADSRRVAEVRIS